MRGLIIMGEKRVSLYGGKLIETIDYSTKEISYEWGRNARLTRDEAKEIIRKYGKRAQSRLTTLQNSYNRGLLKHDQPTDLLVKYRGFNVKMKNLTDKELIKKAKIAIDILSKKSSLVSKITGAKMKAFETFKRNHKLSKLTYDEYKRLMIAAGQFQQLTRDKEYDSAQTILMLNWLDKTGGDGYEINLLEGLDPEKWFLDMAREEKTGKWISMESIESGGSIPEELPF